MAERILIVEDEPEFAALLELWVGKSGYLPIVATTGQEALRFSDATGFARHGCASPGAPEHRCGRCFIAATGTTL